MEVDLRILRDLLNFNVNTMWSCIIITVTERA